MKPIKMFKMPFKTKCFNEGQKVWVRRTTGAMAVEVKGKFRGTGRYVVAWVSWDSKSKPMPEFEKLYVEDAFFDKIMEGSVGHEGYDKDGINRN